MENNIPLGRHTENGQILFLNVVVLFIGFNEVSAYEIWSMFLVWKIFRRFLVLNGLWNDLAFIVWITAVPKRNAGPISWFAWFHYIDEVLHWLLFIWMSLLRDAWLPTHSSAPRSCWQTISTNYYLVKWGGRALDWLSFSPRQQRIHQGLSICVITKEAIDEVGAGQRHCALLSLTLLFSCEFTGKKKVSQSPGHTDFNIYT